MQFSVFPFFLNFRLCVLFSSRAEISIHQFNTLSHGPRCACQRNKSLNGFKNGPCLYNTTTVIIIGHKKVTKWNAVQIYSFLQFWIYPTAGFSVNFILPCCLVLKAEMVPLMLRIRAELGFIKQLFFQRKQLTSKKGRGHRTMLFSFSLSSFYPSE